MQHPPRRIPLSIFQSTSMAAIQKTSYFQPEQDEVQAFGGSSCSILVLFCYFRGHFKTFLGSGLIIPNEVKTGYIEDMEVSHAYPYFTFPKARWNGSALSFPALTVSPVPMTGTSSAAFFTLSNMDFSGRMLPRNMVRTRRCTIGSSGGAGSVFSAGSSPKLANQTPFDGSLMIDSTHLKARRTAASLRKKGAPRVS